MTAADREVTPQKLQRNLVYKVCGYAIIGSMLMIGILKVFKVDQLIGPFHATFTFESTALFAFGFAWLIKGEWRLKDQ
jgi:hypothetical protein